MSRPQVTIETGTLQGTTDTDIHGNEFLKFKGIPYAKPPLGDLRFKAPVPAEKWNGILDASKDGDQCYSPDPLRKFQISGSENCLVLNVYTKSLPKNASELRPVLFWVHGGGFFAGSGSEELYGPHYLLTEDVVLVTINYRLGLFGYVNFEDPSLEIPGNAGMKDQVLALKWVQKNISKFGGNPNNVTVFGESAGGASTHLLVLSPVTKGLFHKAIMMSGCALNPWVQGKQGSKHLAAALGLDGADEKTLYKALMEKSTEEILQLQLSFGDKLLPTEKRPTSVVIEKNSKEPFLDDEPINIILSGRYNQVPLMIGYTSAEGMCFEIFKSNTDVNRPTYETAIPWFFGYQENTPDYKVATEKIKQFYFGGDQEILSKKYDLLSDCQFLYGLHTTLLAHLVSAKFPIYLYKMTVETQLNFFKQLIGTDLPGVSHCDDVGYLFTHFATPEVKPGSIEDITRAKFIKLWTNFAKFSNPTPDKNDKLLNATWTPVNRSKLEYLDLGKELVAKSNPDSERIQFWVKLYAESPAGRNPNSPYLKVPY